MYSRFKALFLAAAAALVVANASGAQAQDKMRFTLTGTSMLYMPIYVADTMGYFEAEKIKPEIFHFKAGGAAALAAVLGGNMEVYIGAASSALRSSAKGADALLIGAMVTRYSIDIVLRKSIAASRGITDASDEIARFKALKGLKIGVSGAGSGTHQIAQYALSRAGLNSERDATMVFLGDGASTVAAFAANRIDAATTSSPATEIAIRDHGAMLLVDGPGNGYSQLEGFLYVGLIATKRWADANPDLATRTVRSFFKAAQAMHDPKLGPQARDLVHAKYFDGVDKAIFDAAWERTLPGFATDLSMKREQIARVEKFVNDFSSERMNADLDKVFTNRFVEAATH
jgi:NitT/TauT family transport system substrate-binding protein